MRLLLQHPNIDADAKDNDGFSPLLWAARDGYESVVRLLLERQDVTADAKTADGDTALTWASANGHEAMVRLLLEKTNVDVNWKNRLGRNALSLAAQGGHQAIVRLLLERTGSDSGSTPAPVSAPTGDDASISQQFGITNSYGGYGGRRSYPNALARYGRSTRPSYGQQHYQNYNDDDLLLNLLQALIFRPSNRNV
jgi:ankyrin repeat protein